MRFRCWLVGNNIIWFDGLLMEVRLLFSKRVSWWFWFDGRGHEEMNGDYEE